MSNQLHFLLQQAVTFIQSNNLAGAELLLKQILKHTPRHSEAWRYLAYISVLRGDNKLALETIEKSIIADRRNGIAFSNKGNIQLNQGMIPEAIASYNEAIKHSPNYAEAHSNLGNAYQEKADYDRSIPCYEKAISLDPSNPEFFSNLGNAYKEKMDYDRSIAYYEKAVSLDPGNPIFFSNLGLAYHGKMDYDRSIAYYEKAASLDPGNPNFFSNLGLAYYGKMECDRSITYYEKAISLDPSNPEFFSNLGLALSMLGKLDEARKSYLHSLEIDAGCVHARYNLAHLDLFLLNFSEGWRNYDARWFTKNQDKPLSIVTSKPTWDGQLKDNRLFIWAEQGIGDQVLYASMFNDLKKYPQTIIVSVDKKLVSTFRRSFPFIKIISKDDEFPEEFYDEQIPMGGIGKFLRPQIVNFPEPGARQHLISNPKVSKLDFKKSPEGKFFCGISWSSNREKLMPGKSIPLLELIPVLKIQNTNFINLQYGEVNEEISLIRTQYGIDIDVLADIDLFDDIDGLLSIIEACDIVVTTSNTTAHLAGALGKETLLMLPCGNARFWYWHDVDGVSLWYPSIRVFKQDCQGDWSKPIQAVKAYLENRFAI